MITGGAALLEITGKLMTRQDCKVELSHDVVFEEVVGHENKIDFFSGIFLRKSSFFLLQTTTTIS